MSCWHIPFYDNHLEFLNRKFDEQIRFLPVGSEMEPETLTVEKAKPPTRSVQVPPVFVEQMQIRRYSQNTIQAYTSALAQFLAFNSDREPNATKPEQIRAYMLHLVKETDVSSSYQNQAISAIKLYFETALGQSLEPIVIQRPRKAKKLPKAVSPKGVVV